MLLPLHGGSSKSELIIIPALTLAQKGQNILHINHGGIIIGILKMSIHSKLPSYIDEYIIQTFVRFWSSPPTIFALNSQHGDIITMSSIVTRFSWKQLWYYYLPKTPTFSSKTGFFFFMFRYLLRSDKCNLM